MVTWAIWLLFFVPVVNVFGLFISVSVPPKWGVRPNFTTFGFVNLSTKVKYHLLVLGLHILMDTSSQVFYRRHKSSKSGNFLNVLICLTIKFDIDDPQ